MASWRTAHVAIARRPFHWGASVNWGPNGIQSQFLDWELQFLSRWGSWLDALASSGLKPETMAQIHFVDCCQDRVPAVTMAEHCWRKYQAIAFGKRFKTRDVWGSKQPEVRNEWAWRSAMRKGNVEEEDFDQYEASFQSTLVPWSEELRANQDAGKNWKEHADDRRRQGDLS